MARRSRTEYMERTYHHAMATQNDAPASMYARRVLLVVSCLLAGVGLFWIGRSFVVNGEFRVGNPPQQNPYAVRAEVVRVQGETGVRIGDKCEFLVERHDTDDGAFLCKAQVTCSEKLLYGGARAGYFPCKLDSEGGRAVVGKDPSTTLEDQDGALYLDTPKGVLRVWDDETGMIGAFSIEADILSVN